MKAVGPSSDTTVSLLKFGSHWSFNYRNDPKRLAFVLARYKFASQMAWKAHSILELGCSDGIGVSLFRSAGKNYVGVDLDEKAILDGKRNYQEDEVEFIYDDFMGKSYGKFEAVISLDVIEHILPKHETEFFHTLWDNTSSAGIAIIGTPNISAAHYASEASNLGHVNLFSHERLQKSLSNYYDVVLPFGMNDEIVHTGYSKMTHYIFCVCCKKKELSA